MRRNRLLRYAAETTQRPPAELRGGSRDATDSTQQSVDPASRTRLPQGYTRGQTSIKAPNAAAFHAAGAAKFRLMAAPATSHKFARGRHD